MGVCSLPLASCVDVCFSCANAEGQAHICLVLWQEEKVNAYACAMNTANAPALPSAASWSARCVSALLCQHLLATCNMRQSPFWAFEDL